MITNIYQYKRHYQFCLVYDSVKWKTSGSAYPTSIGRDELRRELDTHASFKLQLIY